jgi:hypothetical protein
VILLADLKDFIQTATLSDQREAAPSAS